MATDEFNRMHAVTTEVMTERVRQHQKWGEQNHPDGTSRENQFAADEARHLCDALARRGLCTWALILQEEFAEAMAEIDPVKLRAELIQVAAVAVAWAEAIDRRA